MRLVTIILRQRKRRDGGGNYGKAKSCEKRIDEQLKGRIEDFKEALEKEGKDEDLGTDDLSGWINSYALALSHLTVYKLELSYGGPQDFIEFFYDPESRELYNIVYHFLDWFDGAVKEIDPKSEEFSILEKIFFNCVLIE